MFDECVLCSDSCNLKALNPLSMFCLDALSVISYKLACAYDS